MNEKLPEDKSWYVRQWNNAKKLYYSWFVKNPCFVIQIDEHDLNLGWSKIEQKEFKFDDEIHDAINSYHKFGVKWFFVSKGIRPPIDLKQYVNCLYDLKTGAKLKLGHIAIDGSIAKVKSNTKMAEALVSKIGQSDIIFYIQLATLGVAIIIALGLFDVIKFPFALEQHKSFETLINITSNLRR